MSLVGFSEVVWNEVVPLERSWRNSDDTAEGISISGNVMGFLADGVGEIRIRLRMVAAVADLTVDEMHYPLTNTFFGFQRTATGGQYVIDDGTSTATVDYDWSAGETVTVVIVGDGETMTVGVVA